MSSKNKNITQKSLEINIKNFLKDKSPRLIDVFLIIGFENIYIEEQIIKDIKSVLESNNSKINEENKYKAAEYISSLKDIQENGYGEYKCQEYPSVISSITSDLESGAKEDNYFFSTANFDFQFCLEICLCSSPLIYFSTDKEKIPKEKISTKDYFPYIVTNDANNYCFSYMFYESKKFDKINLYIPKLFCIVSKYPYYKVFHEICKDIYQIFTSDKIQIPLEIQLYNLVNYTPIPIHNKIQYYLFPYQVFNQLKLNSINFFNKDKYLNIDQLSGYAQTQINLGYIFNYFNVEQLIEIYLQFSLYTQIIFFGYDNQKLFLVMHILCTLVFPLLDEESTTISTYNSFCNKDVGKTIQESSAVEINENIYKSLKKKFPKFPTNPNFYVFMDDEIKEFKSNFNENDEENSANEIRINRLYNLLHKIIYEEDLSDSKIGTLIKSIKNNLNALAKEIRIKNLCKEFYEISNDEIEVNNKIRNIFYKFNLDISNFIFIYEKENNLFDDEKQKEMAKNLEETEDVDKLFYWQINKSHYSDIVKNSCKSHEDNKEKEKDYQKYKNNIFRLPRKIYTSFLTMINCNPKENREIDYYRIIDYIYNQKNSSKIINFDFLEFYKFYYNQLDEYFSQVYNSNYMTCTTEEVSKDVIKHFYKYNKIELDSELIMKYLCILDEMEGKIDKDKILNEKNLSLPDNVTKNLDILNSIEKYYFKNDLLKYKEIIRLCLINYIILTIPKKNLVFFNKEESSLQNNIKSYRNFIYDLIDYIYLFKTKYIEMLFSVAYRFFNNSNEANYFYIQPYIDLYDKCVIQRKIIETEEIYTLYKKFKNFADKIKNKNEPKVEESKYENIINHDIEDDLYSFDVNINEREALNKIEDPKFEEKLVSERITLNCIYGSQTVSSEAIYSPKKLFTMIKNLMKDFYVNLELKDDKKETLKDIGISLLFYCNLLKDDNDIPIDMTKYILINLDL